MSTPSSTRLFGHRASRAYRTEYGSSLSVSRKGLRHARTRGTDCVGVVLQASVTMRRVRKRSFSHMRRMSSSTRSRCVPIPPQLYLLTLKSYCHARRVSRQQSWRPSKLFLHHYIQVLTRVWRGTRVDGGRPRPGVHMLPAMPFPLHVRFLLHPHMPHATSPAKRRAYPPRAQAV